MSDLDLVPFRLLIDRVVVPAKQAFRTAFLPVALPVAAVAVAVSAAQLAWFQSLALGGAAATETFGLLFAFLLLVVAMMAVFGLAFGALQVAAVDALAGRPVSMGRAWAFVVRPAAFGTLVITSVFTGLSALLCLVPALFVVPLLSLVLPVMVQEERFGLDALRRSAELARWNPTGRLADSALVQILVLLFVGWVVQYAATMLVQGPFVVVQQYLVLRDAAAGQAADPQAMMGSMWLQLPAQLLGALATVASWFYWTFGLGLLYFELRRRREAEDLRRAIDELTAAPDRSAEPTP